MIRHDGIGGERKRVCPVEGVERVHRVMVGVEVQDGVTELRRCAEDIVAHGRATAIVTEVLICRSRVARRFRGQAQKFENNSGERLRLGFVHYRADDRRAVCVRHIRDRETPKATAIIDSQNGKEVLGQFAWFFHDWVTLERESIICTFAFIVYD